MPSGKKPLNEKISTQLHAAKWRHQATMCWLIDDHSDVWLDREKKNSLSANLCVSVQLWLSYWANLFWQIYISAACADRSILFVLLASSLGGSARGVIACPHVA